MRLIWQLDTDRIARSNIALRYHDAHDSGLTDQIAVRVLVERRGHQTFLEIVELDTGIAQPGDFDNGACAEIRPRTGRQRQQIDAGRGDVLAELAGRNREALGAQLVEQFGMNQMYLAQIGQRRVLAHARAMLDGLAHVGIAGDTQSPEQTNAKARRLAEVVAGVTTDRNDAAHDRRSIS